MREDTDALIDAALARGDTSGGYMAFMPRCALCAADWHGRRDAESGCPGMHAGADERERWFLMLGIRTDEQRRQWESITGELHRVGGQL